MEDLTVFIIMLVLGVLFTYLGYLIWIKEKIELIHDYHYQKVSEADKKPYTGLMGKAVIVIGVGSILTGIINITLHTDKCMIAFGVSFAIALVMITYAQIKYNHGIF